MRGREGSRVCGGRLEGEQGRNMGSSRDKEEGREGREYLNVEDLAARGRDV